MLGLVQMPMLLAMVLIATAGGGDEVALLCCWYQG